MLNRSSSNHALASSSHHNLGQLASQQRAPLPYPGQGPSSLAGSLGYTANLSSAGSDRASPSSVAGRTNLAAQMGFGSNPNLQSLDQLQSQLPNHDQLTWQQQLLAQQQHDSYGTQGAFAKRFQSRQGHYLPAVPTWQNSAASLHQPAAPGQFSQSPTAAAHAHAAGHFAWNGAQSNPGPYPSHHNRFGAGQGMCPAGVPSLVPVYPAADLTCTQCVNFPCLVARSSGSEGLKPSAMRRFKSLAGLSAALQAAVAYVTSHHTLTVWIAVPMVIVAGFLYCC